MKKYPPLSCNFGTPKLSAGLAALILSLGFFMPAGAQTRYSSQPQGTSVKVDGTSTAHDWEMEGKIIGGTIEFSPGVILDAAQTTIPGLSDGKVPVKVRALIPVKSINAKVEHGADIMDHLMWEHLKEDQFGRIEYV